MVADILPNDPDAVINKIEKSFKEVLSKEGFQKFYGCQREALKEFLCLYYKYSGRLHGIIQLPTGAGKTLLAAAIIYLVRYLNRGSDILDRPLVLFLVPREVLREQAYKQFKKVLIRKGFDIEEIPRERSYESGVDRLKKIANMEVRIDYHPKDSRSESLKDILSEEGMYGYSVPDRIIKKRTKVKVLILTPQLLHVARSKGGEDLLSKLFEKHPSLYVMKHTCITLVKRLSMLSRRLRRKYP